MKKLTLFLLFLVLCACVPAPTPTAPQTPTATPNSPALPQPSSQPPTSEIATQTSLPPTQSSVVPTVTNTLPPLPDLSRNLKLSSPPLRGDDVSQLQTWLLALGYDSIGNVDGVFGNLTDASVRQFQSEHNLAVDGVVGPLTWQALYELVYGTAGLPPAQKPTSAYPDFEALSLGDSGERVKALQEQLLALGFPICEVTRQYDRQTEAAVRLFQSANSLATTGILDGATDHLLTSPAAKTAPPANVPVISAYAQYPLEYGAKGLTFEGSKLWFILRDQLITFDPASQQFISAIDIPFLGSRTAFDGVAYPVKFTPLFIFPPTSGSSLTVIGGYGYGYGPGTAAVIMLNSNGSLMGEPVFFPGDSESARVMAALNVSNQAWIIHQFLSEVTLYVFEPGGGLRPEAFMGLDFFETSAYAWDGSRLWALLANEGFALVPVDVYGAWSGRGLGVCGDDLAWDGQWLWVLHQNLLSAYDTDGVLQRRAVPPEGLKMEEIVANPSGIVASAYGKGKNYLLFFEP